MNRTPLFTSLLWTAVGAATAAGCETEEPIDKSSGPAAVVPSNIELAASCGATTTESVKFQIINSGSEPLVVRSAVADNGFVVTAELPATVQPGAAISVSVRPPVAVIGTDVGGSVKTGTLNIESDDPDGTIKVTLRSRIHGANLIYVDAEDKPITKLAMTSADETCPAPGRFFIKNTGNEEAHVETPSGAYAVTRVSANDEILAGDKLEFTVSASSGSDCAISGQITYEPTTDTVCTIVPALEVSQLTNGSSDSCFCGGSSSV
jgi:hypothetical protein